MKAADSNNACAVGILSITLFNNLLQYYIWIIIGLLDN